MSSDDGSSGFALAEGPRNFTTTPNDHGGIALTVCTLLATWTILCFGVRLYMRLHTPNKLIGLDDAVAGIATLFAILQTIASTLAISSGFGKALFLLSVKNSVRAEKAVYAGRLLYIITNALAKCAAALLVARLTSTKTIVRLCYSVVSVSAIWGATAVIAQAVPCASLPPWDVFTKSCHKLSLWQAITAFDVAIEVAMFALPVCLVWHLQTNFGRKIVIMFVFGLRLFVIAPTILRLQFLAEALRSDQPFLQGVKAFICLSISMNYGLIAVTIPILKPFVSSFNTGWVTFDTQGVSGYGPNSN